MKYIDSPKISTGTASSPEQIINYFLPSANGQYLSITGQLWVASDLGFRFNYSGKVIGILFSSTNIIDRDVVLFKNDDIIYTFSSINNNIYINNGIEFLYDAGDLIKIFVNNKPGQPLKNFIAQIIIQEG